MDFNKNRKRSGMVLTGVVLCSGAISAMNQGVVGAVPQSDVVDNALKSFAGEGTKNLKLMLAKIIAIAFVSVVILYICYAIYQYFVPKKEFTSGDDLLKDDEEEEKGVVLEWDEFEELVGNFDADESSEYSCFLFDASENAKKLKYDADTETFVALNAKSQTISSDSGRTYTYKRGYISFSLKDDCNAKYKNEMEQFRKDFLKKIARKKEAKTKKNINNNLINSDKKVPTIGVVVGEHKEDFEFGKLLVSVNVLDYYGNFDNEFNQFLYECRYNVKDIDNCTVVYNVDARTFKLLDKDGNTVKGEKYLTEEIKFCLDQLLENDEIPEDIQETVLTFRRKFFEAAGASKMLEEIEKMEEKEREEMKKREIEEKERDDFLGSSNDD